MKIKQKVSKLVLKLRISTSVVNHLVKGFIPPVEELDAHDWIEDDRLAGSVAEVITELNSQFVESKATG